ncbi:TPA: hypothetical protein DCX15_06590 [bacterium]|nr:hypothetical protein [bacterium]
MPDIRKALTVTSAGVLTQPEIDKEVVDMIEYKNPLRQNLPRRPGSGLAWIVNRRTPSAATPPAFIDDLDDVPMGEGAYTQVSFTYKTLGAGGKVSRRLQAAGKTYIDILAEEIEDRADEWRRAEEKAVLWGDTSVNAKEFDGLYRLTPTQNLMGTVGTTTGGGPLTLALLDEAIDLCDGKPNMLVMSSRTLRRVKAILIANQRFIGPGIEVQGGMVLPSYNEIPIYVSDQIMDTMTWNGQTKVIGLTGGTLSAIFVVTADARSTFIGELTPITFKQVDSGTVQYDKFEIVGDETLVVRRPTDNSILAGIW